MKDLAAVKRIHPATGTEVTFTGRVLDSTPPVIIVTATAGEIAAEGSVTLAPVDGGFALPAAGDVQQALDDMRARLMAQVVHHTLLAQQIGALK